MSQRQDLLLVRRHSHEHAVKNVVVSLLWGLCQNMQLFIWQISSSTFILLYLHLKDFTLYRLIFIISYEDGLPVDKHVISLVGTVQSGPPRLLHFYWSGCQYIFQSGWSCHCGWFLHYQKLQNKTMWILNCLSEKSESWVMQEHPICFFTNIFTF